MKKQTILMVHNYYQIGGGEHTVFENEVAMLRKNGHKVITYTRSNDELKKSKWKLLMTPFSTIWSWKTYREVREIIKKESIEIVHCHNTFPLISPSVYYAARSRKVPVVQTIHNFRLLCPNGIFHRNKHICEDCRKYQSFRPALKHKCYRDSWIQTAVAVVMLVFHRGIGTYKRINYIFLTDFNRSKFQRIIDINGENIFIKPNFVEQPQITREKAANHKIVLVFAGRLEENKGIDFLLRAWKSLPLQYELHIYGDGALKTAVESVVREQSNIKYFGFMPQKSIFEDLVKAQAMIFPSRLYEGFPMTIAESFSLGVPVVATDIGNHADLVKWSNAGVLFPYGDESQFRRAIDEVIFNNERYSQYAKAYYTTYLTPNESYKCLSRIYGEVSSECR